MRILLADDSRAMRTLFRSVLERLGHADRELLEAKDGPEALIALKNKLLPVDAVVFDWDLPGLDGLAFMGQLKALGLAGKVAVLLSVNRQQKSLLPQALRLGPCDTIDRPFTEEMFELKFRSLGLSVQVKRAESSKVRTVAPMPEADPGMPFLMRLPSSVIDDVLKLAEQRRHEPGTILLRAGQTCDSLHIVTRGQIELLAGLGGKPLRVTGEGDPFGEFSFMMSEPSLHTVRARTLVLTASLSKSRISDLLRKHPSLEREFSTLMTRHKEVMTARATTIVQSDFKGTFDTMPFANVVQILNVGRKTGVLGIRQDELSGGIYLENGEAMHAWTEDLAGEQAFYAMSGWSKAKWAFNSMKRNESRTLQRGTITLLMEAMRRLEETPSPAAPSEDVGLDTLFPAP